MEQFFLVKTLNDPQYFPENKNIEISLEKSNSVISDINSNSNININEDNDKTKNDKNDVISFNSQETIKNNKDNIFSNFISGNMFENEAINYLRSKLMNNLEISSVFYTITKLKNQSLSIFYNEFDGIFIIKDRIQFDKNIIRINCKYENDTFINSKKEGNDVVEIKGKNLLFIETKKNANFGGSVFGKLTEKVYKFRNFIDYLYGTKDYGVVILYLYDNEFCYNLKDFEKFKKAISQIKQKNEVKGIETYTIYTFYIYNNISLYNHFVIKNELNKTNIKLDYIKDDLNNTKIELNNTKIELNSTKIELNNTKIELNNMNNELSKFKNEFNEEKRKLNNKLEKLTKLVSDKFGIEADSI